MSRYFVIALAFVAAGVKGAQGAWVEVIGLSGLGVGLAALKVGTGQPAARSLAYVAFAVTALAVAALAIRQWAS